MIFEQPVVTQHPQIILRAAAALCVSGGVSAWCHAQTHPADPSEITCFPSDPTPEQLAYIQRVRALAPTQAPIDPSRFILDNFAWQAGGSPGIGGGALPVDLTYSFPKDTTTWGLEGISVPGPSELSQKLIALFGSGNLDLGREHIRQALATWRRAAGITYQEVADDNAPMDQLESRVGTRGDIRFGGRTLGINFFLAYNAFPSAQGGGIAGGGDMFINTSYFQAQWFNNPADNFRYFRNVVAHEHGHGLGLIHTVPCDATKLMEPFISVLFDAAQWDDIRAAQRNYGDRFAPNHSAATAKDLGELSPPTGPRSVREVLLSTNGSSGINSTNQDFFRFTLAAARPLTITAQPVGGTYPQGSQIAECDGVGINTVDATNAGDLTMELRDSSGFTVLFTSAAGGPGVPESITTTLQPGTYFVRVFDTGFNPPANQTVQLYNLTVRVAGALYPPRAIAGVHKRTFANAKCFFIGNVASWVNEPGATMGSWDWDLDGDGTFETTGAQVFRTYPSNGTIPVTLRVTDSNGLSATDTINVTVFNAAASITGVSPGTVPQGSSTPVVITGTNLKGVTSASQFTASGSGVTFTGTPVVNPLGTQVTGLSVWVGPWASTTARTISVTNSDGLGTTSGNATSAPLLTPVVPTLAPGPFALLTPANNAAQVPTSTSFSWATSAGAFNYHVIVSLDPGLGRVVAEGDVAAPTTTFTPPASSLAEGNTYFWHVLAQNPIGNTYSSPTVFTFSTTSPLPVCQGDLNADGLRDVADLTVFLGSFGSSVTPGTSGDLNGDGAVNVFDLTRFLSVFGVVCEDGVGLRRGP